MASFQRPSRLLLLVVLCLSFVVACSSGGKRKSPDTTPDPFTISALTGVDPNNVAAGTFIESEPVLITSIEEAANVSITGGEFAVGNGAFSPNARTVNPNQTIKVRVKAPTKAGQSATAKLNVGGVTASFTVTTEADTTPPEVAILFPPPASMTEGGTLFLRGTVKDVHGTLAEGAVKVNGVVASLNLNSTHDEGEWSVEVELEDGLNSVTVTAEDAVGNSDNSQSVAVTKAPITSAFPDENSPLSDPVGIVLSVNEDSAVAYVTEPSLKAILAVDLNSGARRVVSDNNLQAEDPFDRPWRLTMGADSVLYVTDRNNGNIYAVDTETSVREIVPIEDPSNLMQSPRGIVYSNNGLYVAHGQSVFFIDLATGVLTSVASQSGNFIYVIDLAISARGDRLLVLNNSPVSFASISLPSQNSSLHEVDERYGEAIAIDYGSNLIYVANPTHARIMRFDEALNQITDLTEIGSKYPENSLIENWGIAKSPELGFIVVTDRWLKGLVAMDVVTGRKVIISKSATVNPEE
jgi:hypothetical protein